jgi:hypothetical protein
MMTESQHNDSTVSKKEALNQAREEAKEFADEVDHLSDFLLVVDWQTSQRSVDQSLTITYEAPKFDGEGWEVIKQDGEVTQKEVFAEDFASAYSRFIDCLEEAQKERSVMRA